VDKIASAAKPKQVRGQLPRIPSNLTARMKAVERIEESNGQLYKRLVGCKGAISQTTQRRDYARSKVLSERISRFTAQGGQVVSKEQLLAIKFLQQKLRQ
jgi:hypothetical protein